MKSPFSPSRRQALKLGLGGVLAATLSLDAAAQEPGAPPADPAAASAGLDLQNFSFDALSAIMRERAAAPYEPPAEELPGPIGDLDYDSYRRILYRRDRTVWADEPGQFHLQAYFPGFLYRATTRLHVGDGQRFRLLAFTGADFEFLAPLDPAAFAGLELPGVAGFRLNAPIDRPDVFDEVVSFLGASYFRALGRDNRYGLSARGVAINTATSASEEFPRFTDFYIVRPSPDADAIMLYAALESASLTGAYAFTIRPGRHTVIDVVKRLYFRAAVDRLGIAPLTSMFFYGENQRPVRDDFRPEVHDSDGLQIVRANGERLWRPLRNPQTLALSYFAEASPRSFGLYQRDRSFAHYEDVGARYEARPSLRIEPQGDWGLGVVQLVEIPTDSEANDNIVAFWVPEARPEPGSDYEFRYRMSWGDLDEMEAEMAVVQDTYAGIGGNAAETGDTAFRRFEINFAGGIAANLPLGGMVEAAVDLPANAQSNHIGVSRLPDGGWRASLELQRLDDSPVELRARLTYGGRTVSETWLYQWS